MGRREREIFNKTGGHCHFCGDPLVFGRRGKAGRRDGAWEIDHVRHRLHGGGSEEANLLPACTECNRLRWHTPGRRIRQILELGLIARREVEELTDLGRELVRLSGRET